MAVITEEARTRLRRVADALIPAAHGMPAASDVGVADDQLDRVLAVRPDLAEPMERALAGMNPADAEGSLDQLQSADPEAADALLMTIVGGYYIHPGVRERLEYDGQQPVEVRPEVIPDYVEEGLIDPVLARGPIYRRIPGDQPTPAQPDDRTKR
jgi:hypothetical protein